MMSHLRVFLLLTLIGFTVQAADLPAPVSAALRNRGLDGSGFSAFIQEIGTTEALLAFNADVPRNPASAIKVLTTYAGLELLGPAHQWHTRVYVDGGLHDGVLDGNLILQGGGDPFLVIEHFWQLLRGVRDRGVQHINGDLVLDNHYFELPAMDPGAFDGEAHRAYNALPDALLVNFQALRFVFLPQAGRIRIFAEPAPANLVIDNQLQSTGGACQGRHRNIGMHLSEANGITTARFDGGYPAACGESDLYRVVMSNHALVGGVFRDLWAQLGGTLSGSVVVGRSTGELFHTQSSRSLAELIRGMNKFSINVMTRQLLLSIAAERLGIPGTLEKGHQAIAGWLEQKGLVFPELILDNGAGLSRRTQISARNLGRLLLAADASSYRAELLSSLPIAAVDGTLRRRFRDEPIASQVRVKTGTLNNVRAMAGFLSSRSGKRFVVVSLHNASGVDESIGTEVQNALLRWLFER